ncbi:hypothetical protein COMA2_250005 [Candidatus Nitrospira nitrificans]|uniref:Uncharacterized protein n=1 Tax=Candidatus Nitrospira nitrificans TaxID=1742973 RepID=A0A0S4LIZ6_9BACT|nr:hypothetical protein COMA2_250005 [Candidatus Nitrospira nitrificans]
MPVLDWQLHFPGGLRVPESSTCDSDLSIPVETGRPLSLYVLKRPLVIREARNRTNFLRDMLHVSPNDVHSRYSSYRTGQWDATCLSETSFRGSRLLSA